MDLNNEQSIVTDDNAFEFIYRPFNGSNGLSGNLFPTVYAAYIYDGKAQLSVCLLLEITFYVLLQTIDNIRQSTWYCQLEKW